ncbi:MAG: hypothetical protein K2O00_07785 [Muribaculaceae bacterium]|nr:hypothetical protein [Muribaculaceae bacterium]
MARIIAVGEAGFHIRLEELKPLSAHPGGLILNTAVELSRMEHQVSMATEIGSDVLGHKIIDILKKEGVDTYSVELSLDGTTPTTLEFVDTKTDEIIQQLRYDNFENCTEGFDIIWPTIETGDTIIFGGFLSISMRVRKRLWQFLTYAKERKANLIYLPGYNPVRMMRVTKVMPLIFENLEIADIVITTTDHLQFIFGKTDTAKAYKDNLEFYVNDFFNIGDEVIDYHAHGGQHERIPRISSMKLPEALAWLIDNKILSKSTD